MNTTFALLNQTMKYIALLNIIYRKLLHMKLDPNKLCYIIQLELLEFYRLYKKISS